MKSKWKCNKILLNISSLERFSNRSYIIYKRHIGLVFNVSDGKNFVPLEIVRSMVGYKFGDFVLTKKVGGIHNLKKVSTGFRRKRKNR